MIFHEKLNLLMDLFHINGRMLSKAIHVDPSLVSKWQNGKRVPSYKSAYIEYIVDYFLGFDILEYQKKQLDELIVKSLPQAETGTRATLRKALIEWLLTPDEGVSEKAGTEPAGLSPFSIQTMLSGIQGIPALISQSFAVKLPEVSFEVNPGQIGQYELFRGNEGKRQAMLRICALVLQSGEPLELAGTSHDDLAWLIEDQEYLSLWKRVFREMLLKGHKLTMIHKLDRHMSQVVFMLNQWIPLHLTGQIDSWYSKYVDNRSNITLLIVKGKAALFSIPSERESEDHCTMIYRDPAIVKMLENYFTTFLAECSPMMHLYSSPKMKPYGSFLNDFSAKPGYCYSLLAVFGSQTLPPALYERLLERAGFSGEDKEWRLSLHRNRLAGFEKNIAYYPYWEIYQADGVDRLVHPEGAWYPGLYFLSNRGVQVQPSEIVEHLRHIIALLKKHKNYEVAITNQAGPFDGSNRLYLAVKEDYALDISTWDNVGNNPIILTTGEGTILQAFEHYLTEMRELIPRSNRNKEWVINKLTAKIGMLEKVAGK